ncbi:hypothetical protein GCM10010276_23100 [Streptomyces longisporus]|uniref:PRC-barrel domain-containing protein n=1 Tax=Streptomyces longisporus TaxID=1948 RepID=A0ABN3LI57_STRLO
MVTYTSGVLKEDGEVIGEVEAVEFGSVSTSQQPSISSVHRTASPVRAARISITANSLTVSVSRTPSRRAESTCSPPQRTTDGRTTVIRRHRFRTRATSSGTAKGLTR